jgi:hypothetical protein
MAKDWPALWEQLGGGAERAHQAMGILDRAKEQTVAWLKDQLLRSQPPDSERVVRLLRELDDEQFAVREQAQTQLHRLGELVQPALRKALEGQPTAEVRRRVTRLLEQLDRGPSPEQLRSLRAIEVLERLGTPEARKVLEELAKGTALARQTQEATASLDRLARRPR